MVTRVTLIAEEWNEILLDFADCVSDGMYEKMPYHKWREIKGIELDKYDFICIEWEKDRYGNAIIDVISQDSFFYPLRFNSNDQSFGSFIYENHLQYIEMNRSKRLEEYPITTKNENNNNIEKENNTMKFNFDFGPVNPSLVRMSMYGLAVKNKSGTWVSYNSNSDEIVDVDVLNFDGAKFLYRMPVAIKDIAVGDVVVHNGAPMFVVFVPQDGKALTVVDTVNGERKDIMLSRSPFGFNFATKVVNFLGNMMTGANADNPFGNMWMLMAMSGEGEGKNMNDILPFLMMNNATTGMDTNMLMFMALSNTEGGSKDMLPWLLMSQNMNAAPAHECKCGGNCGNHQPQN